MKIIKKKLSELKRPEHNVRLHTQKQIDAFFRTVTMFGQIRPIIIDENNVILAGNGLYEALLKMGKESAECYQYIDLTENQKKKLMIADNKIFTLGVENLDEIQSIINSMQDDLDIPGYDEDILKQMVGDAEEITETVSRYGTLDQEEIDEINSKKSDNLEPDPAMPAPSYSNTETAETQQMKPVESSGEEAPAEPEQVRKFVICPKCGEKIWL